MPMVGMRVKISRILQKMKEMPEKDMMGFFALARE